MHLHHENIEGLRDEAIRIAKLEIKVINSMISQGILQAENKDKQTFDTVSAPKTIEILEGEIYKLQNLDMVLAVVGTMKAGKSTTINAIVGTEILPNRNAPMTAIPTLIRHTKGQAQPKLVFDDKNCKPLNDLMAKLLPRISMPENQQTIQNLVSDRDLFSLIEKIRNKQPINNQAVGAEAIFEFLKSVNDLVRVSPKLGEEFPFESYQKVDNLPVIEIEFTHLKEMGDRQGRLILLDTPGPNEAGQHHLRPMLQDQLRKASAVLAVMDYTQLKSEADAQIREELASIAEKAEGRIYALVNKFDQKDRNGMQAEEVRSFVEDLTNKQIAASKVFPVSSKQGYLSNRARHELQLHGKLPEITEQPWVEDFYNEAKLDEDDYDDIEEVEKKLRKLWSKSNFSQPLKEVIEVAYDKAALNALCSASAKYAGIAVDINNFLKTTEVGLGKNTSDLQKLVDDIQLDISKVNDCEKIAQEIIEYNLKQLDNDTREITSILKEKNKNEFQRFLEIGMGKTKEIQESNEEQSRKKIASSTKMGEAARAFLLKEITKKPRKSEYKRKLEEITANSEKGVVNFYQDKQKAEAYTQDIQIWVEGEIGHAKLSVEEALGRMTKAFEKDYKEKVIRSATQTLKGIKNTLDSAGLEGLKIELPSTTTLDLNINIAGLLSDAIKQETKMQTRYRDAEGVAAKAKRFFGGLFSNSDWGKESYQEKINEYRVDLNLMQKKVFENVDIFFDQMNSNIQKNIKQPIEDSSTTFFEEFKQTVKHVRADLIGALNTKQQDQRVQDELLQKISLIKKNMPDLESSTDDLKKNLEKFG